MEKFLFITDQPNEIKVVGTLLEKFFPGLKLIITSNFSDATQLALTEDPDVIISSSFSIDSCAAFKQSKHLCHIPVLFLTNETDSKESKLNMLGAGADAFIHMPIDEIEVVALIKAMTKIKKLSGNREEQKFRNIVETIPVTIYMSTGVDQIAEYLNPKFIEVFGYTLEDVPSAERWWPLAFPDEKYRREVSEIWQSRVSEAIEMNSEIEPMEVVVTCKDGTQKYILFNFSVLESFNYTSGIDITQRKKAEIALRESEERYILALNATSDGIWDWNIAANTEYTSPRWREILGYETGDPELSHPTESWEARIHPDYRELVRTKRHSLTRENNDYFVEYPFLHKSGRYCWLRSIGKAIFDQDGQPVRLVGSILDITDRKLAEEALRASEEDLNQAQEMLQSCSWELSLKTGKLKWSKNYYQMMEVPLGTEMKSDFFMERVHPDDLNLVHEKLKEIRISKKPLAYDVRVRMPDDKYHWFENDLFPVFEGDDLIRLKGVNIDITSKKINEAKISYQNQRLSAIISAIPDLIFVIDKNGIFLEGYASDGQKLLVSPEHINGRRINELFDKTNSELLLSKILRVLETNEIASTEYNVSLPLSNNTNFEARLVPLDTEKVLVISRDVTERVKKDIEIKRLTQAVEQSPVAIVITDLEANIEYANPATLEMTGYSMDEIIGRKANILKSGLTDDEVYKDLWGTITKGKGWQGEWINKKKNGQLYWESVSITPIFNKAGEITNFLGVSQDINTRKRTEAEIIAAKEKAEESDRLKSAFLNNMGHEIRTPLNAIIGFSNAIKEADGEDRKHFAEIIEKNSDQLLLLFDDILHLSRLQSKELQLYLTEFKPDKLIREVFQMFDFPEMNKGIETKFNFPIDCTDLKFSADEGKIRQVLTILVSNAFKYTTRGYIETGFSLQNETIEFYIEDTGIGIPEKEQQLIFDTFYRGEKAIKAAIRGTGLGLNIARELINLMRGSIGVTSEIGRGSRFYFTIPIEKQEIKQEGLSEIKTNPEELKNLLILIVEDEKINYRLLEYLLKDIVKKVDIAVNGKIALELAAINNYDLILMDMKMPVMGGIEATKNLKSLYPHIPIIAQTAYTQPEEKLKAMMAGCDDFMSKPIKKEVLMEIVNKYAAFRRKAE